jgi:hypothetical protein
MRKMKQNGDMGHNRERMQQAEGKSSKGAGKAMNEVVLFWLGSTTCAYVNKEMCQVFREVVMALEAAVDNAKRPSQSTPCFSIPELQ